MLAVKSAGVAAAAKKKLHKSEAIWEMASAASWSRLISAEIPPRSVRDAGTLARALSLSA